MLDTRIIIWTGWVNIAIITFLIIGAILDHYIWPGLLNINIMNALAASGVVVFTIIVIVDALDTLLKKEKGVIAVEIV